MQLKIKDNVDLAGVSPLLLPLNLSNSSLLELLETSLNHKSWIVTLVDLDVMEVLNIKLWISTLQMESVLNLPTHTKLVLDHVNNPLAPKILSPSLDTSLLKEILHSKTLSLNNQLPLP